MSHLTVLSTGTILQRRGTIREREENNTTDGLNSTAFTAIKLSAISHLNL